LNVIPGAMAEKDQNTDVATLNFETALAELEKIVANLESGDTALEESIAKYERGEALKVRCEALLSHAEGRIEKITRGPNGAATGAEPLDVD